MPSPKRAEMARTKRGAAGPGHVGRDEFDSRQIRFLHATPPTRDVHLQGVGFGSVDWTRSQEVIQWFQRR